MVKGKINVQTENIFPIIKKFLYSDHEIFLRELISNAVDACTKMKALASIGEFTGELGDMTILVKLDKQNKTLSVTDAGIGMTAEEVDKYINQIAFSSAEGFLKKFKDKSEREANALIGHFGLGFYSSFMVASHVDIYTKTYKKGPGSKAVHWACDGSPDYEIEECDRKNRGTEVVLHISDDSAEFLEENTILGLLQKYCRFLPVPIQFGTKKIFEDLENETDAEGKPKRVEKDVPRIINNINPLWKQKPAGLTDEDYIRFYRELYPLSFEEPLFHIHLNVDYPFNLTGILYFPKVKKYVDIQRNKIQLFSNQVYITDSVEGIVPDFLTLLHGVIDSPDIPLNVSRSYLQSDQNVRKISGHITKKVADKLEEIFKTTRQDFEKKWDDIKVFIEYGMITDEKFFERADQFCLLKNAEGRYFTFNEYKEKIKEIQTDKEGFLNYLYTPDPESQHMFFKAASGQGYDVLIMDGPLDNHFINQLESKFEKTKFKRIDSESIEKLVVKDDLPPSKLTDEEKDKLKPLFENAVDKERFHVQTENLSENAPPILITQSEFMRRMKEMAAMGGGMSYMDNLPDHYELIVNTNHAIMGKLLSLEDETTVNKGIRQLIDLAMLSQNLLKGEELTGFVNRSIELMNI